MQKLFVSTTHLKNCETGMNNFTNLLKISTKLKLKLPLGYSLFKVFVTRVFFYVLLFEYLNCIMKMPE